jgi:hypothetical protein
MLRKLMTGAVVLGAVLATGVFSQTAKAGTIGTVTAAVDPAHDLRANLILDDFDPTLPAGKFDFEGPTVGSTNPADTFVLTGSYDTTTNTAIGTFTASGFESPTNTHVSYSGTVDVMDIHQALTAGTLMFEIDPPLQQNIFVLVNFNDGNADTSPIPSSSVPAPATAAGGAVLMGILGIRFIRRRVLN